MEFSLRLLRQSKTFIGVTAFFVLANGWSWLRHIVAPVCCDQELTIGFPMPFHISGGIAGISSFYLLGLLLDIVITLTFAIAATWIVRLIRR
jgi:hypothetical protein